MFSRNGAFEVNDAGYIVDSNGQFLLGYPVDDAGAVSDKTLQGATKMQLASNFGEPQATNNIKMGVNLPSDAEIIAADVEFDPNDAKTYSASSSVTIFDNGGNPKSATVFYIKTQDPSATNPTYKYDTKMFVDGTEILPTLTRATDTKGTAQFIDKFGQKTTTPEDPAYILEGKGSPLYKADDLGEAQKSTPAMLTGLGLESYLGDGRTIEVVTDPMQFKRTMEYQSLANVDPVVPGTFWGKDFLLVDVDNSGPVSIDIPPGTYDGEQLAHVVEVALRDAFGDDKKVQLTEDVDSTFTIDFKQSSGDGKSTGLPSPISIDLHEDTLVTTTPEDGMSMNEFLTHAQVRINTELNEYIQNGSGAETTKVANIGAEGKLFKKVVGDAITTAPDDYDVITVAHTTGGALTNRYLAYSNVGNNPDIKAYDNVFTQPAGGIGAGASGEIKAIAVDSDGYLNVTINGVFTDNLEVLRFQQNDAAPAGSGTEYIDLFGSNEIAIKSYSDDNTDTTYARLYSDRWALPRLLKTK